MVDPTCDVCRSGRLCLRHATGLHQLGSSLQPGESLTISSPGQNTEVTIVPDQPLDPDQVACPQCDAPPGIVCRAPSGRKARTVHRARRDLAAGFDTPATATRSPRSGATPPSREKSAEGGRKGAQTRNRRRAEAAAAREAERERLQAEADAAHADRLARDAVKWDEDRMRLRRRVLDMAWVATDVAATALSDVEHVVTDADGRVQTTGVESTNKHGDPITLQLPDARGGWKADAAQRLTDAAVKALTALRLEEGEVTSRTATVDEGPGVVGDLAELPLARLRGVLDELDGTREDEA